MVNLKKKCIRIVFEICNVVVSSFCLKNLINRKIEIVTGLSA